MKPADQPNARVWGGEGYFNLPVVNVTYGDGTRALVTAWELDPQEVADVVATGRIWLSIEGTVHPPVLLSTRCPYVDDSLESPGTNDDHT